MTITVPLQTIDARQMRQVNRSAILELVRQNSPIARSEIGRLLELSAPTVIRIVDELIADGLVRATGEMAGTAGRPRELLEYNRQGGLVIGIDLGGTRLYGALATIGGEILAETHQRRHGSSGEESYALVAESVRCLVQAAASSSPPLLGLAVGAPGVTHAASGVVEWAPSLNWRNFPLKQRLAEEFDLPAAVDNDVNLAVLGEQWFGAGRGARNMILLSLGTGMGGGMVIDGVLYRGFHEAAGEVGYMLPDNKALGRRYADGFGALENIVSGTGITRRAAKLLAAEGHSVEAEALSANLVFEAARGGERWALKIVAETVDYLSLAVANVATLLDPELVILGGGIAGSADLLIDPILQRIDGTIQHTPRIVASELGSKATAMGAIPLVLQMTKDYYLVRRL